MDTAQTIAAQPVEEEYVILTRMKNLVNTDPQRRCYDGCHFSSEYQWGEWEDLEYFKVKEKAEKRMVWWKELNDYAVSERGKGARRQFKIKKVS